MDYRGIDSLALTQGVLTETMLKAGAAALLDGIQSLDPLNLVQIGPYSAETVAEKVFRTMETAKAPR